MRRSATSIAMFLATLTIPAGLAWAQPQDANFTQTTYASGVGGITDLAWAGDGTNNYLFFIQQNGAIRVVRNGTLQGTSVGTVSPVVNSGEMGLLGLAIDPSFSSNRRIFVFVTETGSVQRIYRYTTTDTSGTVGLTGTRMQMGVDMPANNANHDGGGLAFGPDGNLYFGVGNNGNGINTGGNYLPPDNVTNPNPNELSTLGSKIGRMTSSGAPLASNPYYTGGGGARDYIWSRGWRNPFGICFQPGTASPWVLEVGDSWEHIFLATSGSNRGWPTENNTSTTNGKLIPRFRYQRDSGPNWAASGGCLTKGCFYTGSSFPAAYQGNLFFTEYKGGKLVRVIPNGTGTIPSGNVSLFVNNVGGIIDVETGPDGALYYASRDNSAIYRLQYSSGTTQNIVLSTTTLNVNEGATNTFTVRLAAAPASNVIVNVARTAGDTDVTVQSGAMLTFTTANWSTAQTVTLAAAQDADTTNGGATITASSSGLTSRNVAVTEVDNDTVNGAPTASISSPLNGATVSGTNAEFYGDGNDPEGKATLLRAEFYIDDVLYYTDTTAGGHYHLGGDHARWNTTGLSKGSHTLRMTVYDNGGLSGSAQVTVNVDNSDGSDGLLAKYYDDMNFNNLVLTRVDPGVNFLWGEGSPDPSVPVNNFSVRWTGKITPTYSETYTFTTRTDDGVRLWVNGTKLIDQWIDQGPTDWTGTINLQAGKPANIVMEYYENGGGAVAQLSWESASQPASIISSNAMGNVVVGGGGGGGGGGSGGGFGCGLTGLEGLLVLGLAVIVRRRRH